MKFIVISDITYFFRDKIKYLYLIIFVLILYPLSERMVYFFKGLPTVFWHETQISSILVKNIGASFDNSGLSDISFYIPIVLYTYLHFQTISCYFNQLKYGPENIFLRLNKTKWLICKYLSIFVYITIFQIIIYPIIITVCYILGLKFDLVNILPIFIFDTLVKIYFSYIVIIIVSLFNKLSIPIIYIILFLGMFNIKIFYVLNYLYGEIYIINNKFMLALVIFMLVMFITFIINRIMITKLFMKEEML